MQDQDFTDIQRWCVVPKYGRYSTGFKQIEYINATATQPQHNVLKYFTIFKNIAHSLEPGETPSDSASHLAPNYVQRS